MSDELAKKKRVRGAHKASATKIMQQIAEIVRSERPDQTKLSCLRLALNEKFETIKALDVEVIDLIDDDGVVDDIERADEFKETIFSSLLSIDRLIQRLKPPPATKDSEVSEPSVHKSSSHPRVKLPKLQLRSFSGDLTQWTGFWDSFQSAVHNNEHLSEIEKFNYLNSLLERAAKEAISGFALTAANYCEAISTLKKRFGGKQQIVDKHLDVLFNIEPVVAANNVRGLRRLFDTVTSHIRSLQSLEIQPATYASTFCPKLLTKLPNELRLIVSRSLSGDVWNLNSMLTAIEQELTARERSGMNEISRQPQHHEDNPSVPTATALMSGNSPSSQLCCYCSQSHKPANCEAVVQVVARKQILKRFGRCFVCLKKGHRGRECRSSSRCRFCKGRHHSSICGNSATGSNEHQDPPSQTSSSGTVPNSQNTSNTTPTLNPKAPAFTSPSTSTSLYVDSSRTVLLQTALAQVYNPTKPSMTMRLRIILDSGSQRSYLTDRAKNALGLKSDKRQHLSISTFGATRGDPRHCEVVRIGVITASGQREEFELLIVPHICEPILTQPVDFCSRMYSHLTSLNLADTHHGDTPIEVDMLVGSDFYWQLTTGEIVRGEGGPVAINTKLGWVLSGPVNAKGDNSSTVMTVHTLQVDAVSDEQLDKTLRSFWELESLGVEPLNDVTQNPPHTIELKDGRYEVSLPWKEFHRPLPDNYELSLKRLKGLLQKLKRDPEILKEYSAIIQEQLDKGIIEIVEQTAGRTHYLPHHAVVRRDKETTKVRIVYDASARAKGPSLNDCLHTGPKFNQKILEILIRFRSYPVAWIADIEKAFLMIAMSQEDRDVLRFVWVDNPLSSNPNVIIYRFARVVFGVSSSPYLLNSTIQHHLKQYSSRPEVVAKLLASFYVDDLVCGGNDEEEAYDHFSYAREVLTHASFNLRKFITNSHVLRERMRREAESDQTHTGVLNVTCDDATSSTEQPNGTEEHKVLGVCWNIQSDQFVFQLSTIGEAAVTLVPTKRRVISLIGSFYDPLGFLSPVIIRFKVLVQELCRSQVHWDKPLEGETLKKWTDLATDLIKSKPVTIDRSYFHKNNQTKHYQLFGFCDASAIAYAAVIYLVEIMSVGKHSSFVVAKTRVSPLKVQTIPRLELLSALLLARLMKNVTECLATRLTLEAPRCFTDSQIALFWIKGTTKDWKPFIQNRVNEIRRLVPTECWDHCSGKSNPADIPSRGLTSVELAVNELWRFGPSWLQEDLHMSLLPSDIPKVCVKELKSKGVLCLMTPTDAIDVSCVVDCDRYSSVHKLYRITAYVLKFIELLKHKCQPCELTEKDLLAKARRLWISECQAALMTDKHFPTWKLQFNLYLDENQHWRCKGRLEHANLSFAAKHPLILARRHRLTELIVRDAHHTVQHNGIRETLTQIRSQYWIVGGRNLVKSVIHNCVTCRRYEGRPYRAPPPPPLPAFRVNETPPFSYTGVDYAGPLFVRGQGVTDSKVWICLFTCCVTRAIHLELVLDMTAVTFIRCLKRFTARRGLPRKLVSDNAKAFKAAAKTLNEMMKQPELARYLTEVGIEWKFNLEKAPWWGGIFERLVKSVKRCLRKIIGQAKFSYDELNTALVEVEAIINSCPLTYVSLDDFEEPLTPSHLLVGRRLLSMPDDLGYLDNGDEEFTVDTNTLQRRARHLNNVINHFWKRWAKEYLLELRNAHRYPKASQSFSSVREGGVVVVYDSDVPRGFWKIARVTKLLTGDDGHSRGAILRVAARGEQATTLQRPLQLLYPLEIHCGSDKNDDHKETEQNLPTNETCEPEVQTEDDKHPPLTSDSPILSLETDSNQSIISNDDCYAGASSSRRTSAIKARERYKEWSAQILEDDP